MEVELADEIIRVSDEEAIMTTRRLWKEEGVLGGISSGANVFASLKIGEFMKNGDIIVTLIPDNGFRYFSSELFECK